MEAHFKRNSVSCRFSVTCLLFYFCHFQVISRTIVVFFSLTKGEWTNAFMSVSTLRSEFCMPLKLSSECTKIVNYSLLCCTSGVIESLLQHSDHWEVFLLSAGFFSFYSIIHLVTVLHFHIVLLKFKSSPFMDTKKFISSQDPSSATTILPPTNMNQKNKTGFKRKELLSFQKGFPFIVQWKKWHHCFCFLFLFGNLTVP